MSMRSDLQIAAIYVKRLSHIEASSFSYVLRLKVTISLILTLS